MFASFLRRLTATEPAPLDHEEARLALAALLVRLARADGDYARVEIAQIDRVLAAQYGLSDNEASTLRGEAEVLEGEAPDTVRFTRALKDTVPHDDRLALITAMWSVVLADGDRDELEDANMRMIANLLGISDRDSAIARQRAGS
ncbi:TerB family tellurite resistance protein [Rhodobacteraceae bacterium D3-12]|nr:TerB family tellurite resistance protein [Rhodobacteraceae bacterium D3-12]